MKSLKLTDKAAPNFLTEIEKKRNDIDQIKRAFEQEKHAHVTDIQAYIMWKSYSDTWAASWIGLPTSEEIVRDLSLYYQLEE